MGFHSIVQKIILDRKILGTSGVLVSQHALSIPFLLITLFLTQEKLISGSMSLFWIAVAVTTVANVLIQYANVRARELAELSLTAPVQAMTPGLVAVAAIVL